MFVPFITPRKQRVYPRKGGGGGGKGGGSSGGKGGDSSDGSSGSSGSKGGSSGSSSTGKGAVSAPVSGSTGGTSKTSSAYGAGGGRSVTIPQGQLFAGRTTGGGTRTQVFGTQTYGSGYPGVNVNNRGVSGLGFPFVFWPIVWGAELGYGAAYLHDSSEYGDVNNSSRPGGPMTQTVFADSASNNTFHLLADNSTVNSLIESVAANCTLGNTTALTATPLNTSDPSQPRPEQAVQYYRASSVVLTLDGYNNTAALSNNSNLPDTPLPSWVDTSFLTCLNQTIGAAVPLVDASGSPLQWNLPSLGLLGLIWIVVSSVLAV